MIQERVISEFREELQRAQAPGYVSRYDDDYDFDDDLPELAGVAPAPGPAREGPPRETARIDRAAAESDSPVPKPHTASSPKTGPPPSTVKAEESHPRTQHEDAPEDEDDDFGKGVF